MLVAFRLAGLSAFGAHYAGVKGRAQCEASAKLVDGPHAALAALIVWPLLIAANVIRRTNTLSASPA
jgi:hypothetical protein